MRESETKFKVSYIRKPFAIRSFYCVCLTLIALIFGIIGIVLSVNMQGQGGLQAAGFSFCSLVLSVFGIGYGILSFLEKEKNYILSRIGIAICGILVLFWFCLIIIGFGS